MSKAVVVLVFGDVNGQFKTLFRKLKSVTSKLSNAALALCVGNFFSPNCVNEWQKVLKGELLAPTQIFILGPVSNETKQFYPDSNEMSDLAERITYLGKSGTFTTAEGLKLAFVSGKFSDINATDTTFTYQDIDKIVQEASLGRVDILLSWSSPNDFGKTVKLENVTESQEISSSFLFSHLAPQYHLAGREKQSLEVVVERFYEDGTSAGISRFLGLSHLEDTTGVKWMKALNITPYSASLEQNKKVMNIVPLEIHNIDDFTKNLRMKIESNSRETPEYFFSRPNKRRANDNRSNKKHRKKDNQNCWFCLSSPNVEKHMIVSIGEHSFVALAKGPIVDEHMLITSIHHRQSMRVLEKEARNEIKKFKRGLRETFRPSHLPIFYERFFKTSHLQIHCVPIPAKKCDAALTAYKELAKKHDLNVEEFKNSSSCYMTLPEDEPYFHVDFSDGNELIINGLPESFPLNFGREALLVESVLNMPSRKVWQKCEQPKHEEISLVDKFKNKFRPHDFTEKD